MKLWHILIAVSIKSKLLVRFYCLWSKGRPDMTPFSFLDKRFRNQKIKFLIKVNMRDFTYIDDAINLILNFKKTKSKV